MNVVSRQACDAVAADQDITNGHFESSFAFLRVTTWGVDLGFQETWFNAT